MRHIFQEKIIKLLHLLDKKEKNQALALMILSTFIALLDTAGVASVMPFLTVMSDKTMINKNEFLNLLYTNFNFSNETDFLFFLGVFFLILLFSTLILKTLATFLFLRFTRMREYTIGRKLYARYLSQNYEFFVNRHSAGISKTILSEIALIVTSGLVPLFTIFSQMVVVISLTTLLVIMEWRVALISGLVLTFVYGALFVITNKLVTKTGLGRANANNKRFIALSEALGALKEIKLKGLEGAYIQRFADPAIKYAAHLANGLAISQLPRFVLEALIFGGLIISILWYSANSHDTNKVVPIIALYAFAGYKLMPALQQIYGAITLLRLVDAPLNAIFDDFVSLEERRYKFDTVIHTPLNEIKNIELKKIYYSHPESGDYALTDVSLKIESGDLVGIVGSTGAGKTTLADILLGLLKPTHGEIFFNGVNLKNCSSENLSKLISYVPQDIFISDETIKQNIAFGIHPDEIDDEEVIRAAKLACIHDFILGLPAAYETVLGERGGKLSGGQKQRIGIARALYSSPNLLVMDEAWFFQPLSIQRYQPNLQTQF